MDDDYEEKSAYELQDLNENDQNRSFLNRTFGKLSPGSLRSSIFTLISTACGAGCLSIAYVLKQEGVILGLILLTICCLSGLYGLINLSKAAEKYKCFVYADLVEKILGKYWRIFFENVMIVFVIGNLIASQVIIGLFVPGILESLNLKVDSDYDRIFIMIGINWVIMVPLGLQRTLKALRFVSIITPLVLVYICFLLLCEFPLFVPHRNYNDVNYFSPNLSIFPSFGYCLFVFTCHSNVTQLYSELKRRSLPRITKISFRAMFSLLFAYTFLSIFGYFSMLDDTPQQIIMRKPVDDIKNDWAMVLARAVMALSLIIGIPFNIPPSRICIIQCWFRIKTEPSRFLHTAVTLGLLESTLVMAIFYPKILTLFSILGGFCGGFIVLLLPALFRVSIDYDWKSPMAFLHYLVFGGLFLFGTIGAILSVAGIA